MFDYSRAVSLAASSFVTSAPCSMSRSMYFDKIYPGAHGHQFVAWNLSLEQSLPDITPQLT